MDPVCVPDTVVLLSASIMCTPGPGLYTTQQHALQTLQGTWKRLIEYGDEQLVIGLSSNVVVSIQIMVKKLACELDVEALLFNLSKIQQGDPPPSDSMLNWIKCCQSITLGVYDSPVCILIGYFYPVVCFI